MLRILPLWSLKQETEQLKEIEITINHFHVKEHAYL